MVKHSKLLSRILKLPRIPFYTSAFATVRTVLAQHLWTLICIVGLIAIQTLLLGHSVGFSFTHIINGGDTQQLLNPQLFIQRSFSVWLDSGTGMLMPIPGIWIFYAIPLYVFDIFFGNIAISTFVLFSGLFSLSSVSMFLLSKKIIGNSGLAFFISIFYSLNLYTAIVFHTPVAHIVYLFGVTPLLVLTFTKIVSSASYRRKLLYLVIYLLLYLPLVRTLNMFVIYLGLIPLVGFIINFGINIPVKRFLKCFALVSFTIFIVSSPFLLPLISNADMEVTPVTEAYSESAVKLGLGQELNDSVRLIRSYAWKSSYDESWGGVLSYSFLKYYENNLFLCFISYCPILIVFLFFLSYYPKLEASDRHKVMAILVLTALSLFATTPDLTRIGRFLYENEIYILRSAWKYFSIPYILCLSLMLALLLRRLVSGFRTRKLLVFLLILSLIHLAYILPAVCIFGKSINQSWVVETPREYYEVAEFLNEQDEDFRILPLPLPTNFAGYTPYKWGYVGPDILYTLTDKPLVGKGQNTIAPSEYLELVKKLEAATPRELIQYCQSLNVKYILLRNDVDLQHPYRKVYNDPEYYENTLENSGDIKNKHLFGDLVLYELESYMPRVFLVPASAPISNLPEKLSHSVYQLEDRKYLYFAENLSVPITLKTSKMEPVGSYCLNLTFTTEPKSTTEDDWQTLNHVPIQTNLFKVAISPKGTLYVFAYLKDGGYLSLNYPLERMEETSIKLDFKNGTITVYLNTLKIWEKMVEPPSTPLTIKIGSNMQDTERYVGRIYDLDFTVNDENTVNISKLFTSHLNYLEREMVRKLRFTHEKVEWKRISPAKYMVTLNNPSVEDGFFLVLLNTYDPQWKAYYVQNGVDEEIPEGNHIYAFDYANAWYLNKAGSFTIVLEYTPQRVYAAALKTSFLMFGFLLSIIIIPESKMLKLKNSLQRRRS